MIKKVHYLLCCCGILKMFTAVKYDFGNRDLEEV